MDVDIHKAAGLIIVDRKLLLERSEGKDIYVVPGGRIEVGESPVETLKRELLEEFNLEVSLDDLEYFGTYVVNNAKIPGAKVKMETYLVKKWQGEIQISSEIEGIVWVDSSNSENLQLSPFAVEIVLPLLKEKQLVY